MKESNEADSEFVQETGDESSNFYKGVLANNTAHIVCNELTKLSREMSPKSIKNGLC